MIKYLLPSLLTLGFAAPGATVNIITDTNNQLLGITNITGPDNQSYNLEFITGNYQEITDYNELMFWDDLEFLYQLPNTLVTALNNSTAQSVSSEVTFNGLPTGFVFETLNFIVPTATSSFGNKYFTFTDISFVDTSWQSIVGNTSFKENLDTYGVFKQAQPVELSLQAPADNLVNDVVPVNINEPSSTTSLFVIGLLGLGLLVSKTR